MGSGSVLLDYVKITDRASYKQWCLANHPDKLPNDPDATRKFQEVGAEWRRINNNKPTSSSVPKTSRPAPARKHTKPTNTFFNAAFFTGIHRGGCPAVVEGTHQNKCYKKPTIHTRPYCFFHMPNTDHMKFVDIPPHEFFGLFDDFNRTTRTSNMCESKCKSGRFCTKAKVVGQSVCRVHHPDTIAKRARQQAAKSTLNRTT
jgi:hypothetical protein